MGRYNETNKFFNIIFKYTRPKYDHMCFYYLFEKDLNLDQLFSLILNDFIFKKLLKIRANISQ